jgi:hypothetical protein
MQSGFKQGDQSAQAAPEPDGFYDELSGSQLDPKDHLYESRLPKSAPDVIATGQELVLLERVEARLRRVMQWVGFGNFNIIGFDSVLRFARTVESIGAFTPEELDFIEALFARDAKAYGFFGDRVIDRLTAEVDSRSVFKVPASGHYLYRGDSERVYEQIKSDVGESIILTSGVRSVTKQLHLFMAKALSEGGNYTEASRSLAPAGYSYHGIGDFDVGKVGFGARNFTSEFAKTREFEKLMKLGYVAIRYPEGNPYGVYFEPWHIEVV